MPTIRYVRVQSSQSPFCNWNLLTAKVQHMYETDQFTVGQQLWLSQTNFSSWILAINGSFFCEMLNKSMMQVVQWSDNKILASFWILNFGNCANGSKDK